MTPSATTYPAPKTVVTWDTEAFDAFQAARGADMVDIDEKRLQRIFNEAVSPTFHQALDWARENGVRFFIDPTLKDAGAYYVMGTGVVGLNARYASSPMQAAPLLTHEIRHAWQDKQGFIPTVGRHFAEYFMQISLIEADATAYEKLAQHEEYVLWDQDGYDSGMKQPPIQQGRTLRSGFSSWTKNRGSLYGETAARHFGTLLGIKGIKPRDFGISFKAYEEKDKPVIKGIDVSNVAAALATGVAFDGKTNYLDTPEMRDYLAQKMLKPALAQKFYAASRNVPPLVKEVNKRLRQQQQQHRKKTGTDLYL